MLMDTHCHLDDARFDADRQAVMRRAQDAGVERLVIPAVGPSNFDAVRKLAHEYPGGAYALGIHPLFIGQASEADLERLDTELRARKHDPRLVAVGEIGLDFFVPELKTSKMQARQEYFYTAQLRLARQYGLPVILHVRRSQDRILKYLRQLPGMTGVAHAFNGSFQQAQWFVDLGFALGAGGAMTYPRARQIRRLVASIPLKHWVLETDAPDIPPAWLHAPAGSRARNEPAEVARIAETMASLCKVSVKEVRRQTATNANKIFFPHG